MEDKRLSIQDTITKFETKWKTLQSQQKPQQNTSTTQRQVNTTSTLTANQVVKLSVNEQICHGGLCPRKEWNRMNFKQRSNFKKQRNAKFGYLTKSDGNGNGNQRNNNNRQQVPSSNYGGRQVNVVSALRELCDSLEAQEITPSSNNNSANVNASETLPNLRQIFCFGV